MAVNAPAVLRADEGSAHLPLPAGPALRILCGLAWLFVAWGFSFLDRARGDLGFFAGAWLVLGVVGFGLALRLQANEARARKAATMLTLGAGVLTLFPGFLMFVLVRWFAFGLLLVTAARAPAMRTRRDLYYALAAIVAVSLLVITHHNAQWTIWFYLGPAWLCVALALAWDYAARVRLGGFLKAGLTTGFLVLAIAVGIALATLLPLPRMLGFGFLPPGTDNPGRVERPAGAGGTEQRAERGRSDGGGTGTGPGAGISGSALTGIGQRLHEALRDPGLPNWQRSVVEGMLAVAEGLARATSNGDGRLLVRPMTAQERAELQARAAALARAIETLFQALLLALLAWLMWLLRWRIAGAAALESARLLAPLSPALAMRCAMYALRVLLRRHGHALRPGQSVLEHVASAAVLPRLVRDWVLQAVHRYGAWRFGGAVAAPADAAYVRQAVVAANEVLRNRKRK